MQSVTNHITKSVAGVGRQEETRSGGWYIRCSRSTSVKEVELQIMVWAGSEKADLVTDEAKNYIFMLIDIVAKGSMLRLYWRRLYNINGGSLVLRRQSYSTHNCSANRQSLFLYISQ